MNLTSSHGANGKPAASQAFEDSSSRITDLEGECFFGYPLIATPEGKFAIDAVLISPDKGTVLFDLVEGSQVGSYGERQDDIANKLDACLRLHRELSLGASSLWRFHVITFAPAITDMARHRQDGYPISNVDTLRGVIVQLSWTGANETRFCAVLSAVESISSIRKSRTKREVVCENSRGARLK